MLKIGDKIYYIDYEASGVSYTIVNIKKVKDNAVLNDGMYYIVHSDLLSKDLGYYPIRCDMVDSKDIRDRFFSSPEFAKQGYERFRKHIQEMKGRT